MELMSILEASINSGASDIFLVVGQAPGRFRTGKLRAVVEPQLFDASERFTY